MNMRRFLPLILLFGMVLTLGATFAPESTPAATPTWTQKFPSGTAPTARCCMSVVYDAANDVAISFGGKGVVSYNDVWLLRNATSAVKNPSWVQLRTSATKPSARDESSIGYDPATNRMIIYGGCAFSCSPALADAWVLTNANGQGGPAIWSQLPTSPVARGVGVVSGYDPGSNRLIVFGGDQAFPGTERNDVWVLTDANGIGNPSWVQLFPSGTLPAPRDSSGVYDPSSNRLIVFGGINSSGSSLNDSWVLSNANGLGGTPEWTQLAPGGTLPSPRVANTASYDPLTRSLIIFGGYDNTGTDFNDTWVLSNANGLGGTSAWLALSPAGTLPAVRGSMGWAYNVAGNRLVVFYGVNTIYLNDVWLLTDANGK